MADPLHVSEVSEFTFIGKDGKPRTVPRVQYRRSVVAESAAESRRLGVFDKQPVTKDSLVLSHLSNLSHLWICPYSLACVITAARLRMDPSPHKSLTGADILDKFLDFKGPESRAFHSGFPRYNQLFIFFGYIDSDNKRLPSLLVQLTGQRFHLGLHVWVFMPWNLSQMAQRWSSDLLSLSYLEATPIFNLTDVQLPQGKDVVPLERKEPPIPLLDQDGFLSSDKKFSGRRSSTKKDRS